LYGENRCDDSGFSVDGVPLAVPFDLRLSIGQGHDGKPGRGTPTWGPLLK